MPGLEKDAYSINKLSKPDRRFIIWQPNIFKLFYPSLFLRSEMAFHSNSTICIFQNDGAI
ncbi:hypothetical protein GCM10007380_17640 [Gottfriedia solisilvae]|uniref:Uncharacterized protein n=1 Tax=Gottfriedia solisilvae TaxID=1516104 RepID=A0A8J3AN55_9BACI|nr:hypothetical protein GCM10007380_17640 [Gottfriedia solisilvae]